MNLEKETNEEKEIILKNEQRILKCVQAMKDSIFGLQNSFMPYCYSNSKLNKRKMKNFIKELCEISKKVKTYNAAFDNVLPLFFKVSILFFDGAVNNEDKVFSSFRKIASLLEKDGLDGKSTFDIMVDNALLIHEDYFIKEGFLDIYAKFSNELLKVDATELYYCIKNLVEEFIDQHKLNYLYNNEVIDEVIYYMENCIQNIESISDEF